MKRLDLNVIGISLFIIALQLLTFGQSPKVSHNAGKLLLEKGKYSIFEDARMGKNACLTGSYFLVAVYDIAPNEKLGLTLDSFLREIAPEVTLGCGKVTHYNLQIYLKNFWFGEGTDSRYPVEFNSATDLKGKELPFLELRIYLNHDGENWARQFTAFGDPQLYREERYWRMGQGGFVGESFLYVDQFDVDNDPTLDASRRAKAIALQSKWSLVYARQAIVDRRVNDDPVVRAARAEEAWKADQKKAGEEHEKREVARRSAIDSWRPAHRVLAKDVLDLLDKPSVKGAPVNYEFSGYRLQSGLASIYAGDFRPFTGAYDVYGQGRWAADVKEAVKDWRGAAGANSLIAIRARISAYYYWYHRVFEELCQNNPNAKDMPWERVTLQGSGSPPMIYQHNLRTPFVPGFAVSFALAYNLLPGYYDDSEFEIVAADLRKFVTIEKCRSPALRHFEVNLFLANFWLLPLQELYVPKASPAAKYVGPTQKNNSGTNGAKTVKPKPKKRQP